jgi:hypothetical protein
MAGSPWGTEGWLGAAVAKRGYELLIHFRHAKRLAPFENIVLAVGYKAQPAKVFLIVSAIKY